MDISFYSVFLWSFLIFNSTIAEFVCSSGTFLFFKLSYRTYVNDKTKDAENQSLKRTNSINVDKPSTLSILT